VGSYECGCPPGYQFDRALSVCVESGGGCSSAPCAFGCSPTGPSGYNCNCPRGYQSIGDGHCVATVNPSSYQALSRNWDLDDYEEGTDDFISTEGCFSCQMNGGSRKKKSRRRRRQRRGTEMSDMDQFLDLVSSKEPPHDFKINMKVRKEQTRNRQRILRIQPSRSDLVKYLQYNLIEDPSGQLALNRRAGVWELFFKKRVDQPQNITVLIKGDPQEEPDVSDKYINALVAISVI